MATPGKEQYDGCYLTASDCPVAHETGYMDKLTCFSDQGPLDTLLPAAPRDSYKISSSQACVYNTSGSLQISYFKTSGYISHSDHRQCGGVGDA